MMKKQLIYLLTALLMTCFTSTAWAWSGSGTSADPYLIASVSDWNTLATNSASNTYSGTYFKLTDDITVSEMVGTDGSRFAGIFDGNGHTLTFNKGTAGSRFSEQHCGPFRYISGATIKCLHIAGTIYTSNQFAGVVGRTGGTNHFIACRSSLTIDCSKSGDGTNGGFIGVVEGTRTYFTNCLFDGQLLGSSSHSNGGFCGWSQNGVTLTNCLFAPSSVTFSATSSKTFSRGNNVSDSNCYYKQLYGDAQGTNAGSMSIEELQEALGIGWEISGGKVVPIISLRALTGEGTELSPYLIGSATDWDNLAVNVALGETYSGKFFKLTNNITVSEMVGTDQNNHFAGTFDGDGYTLTFNKGTADSRFAENFCAPFRYTRGASLKNLIIAGTIYTSAQFAAVLGNAHGDTYINNCRSSIVINSSISGDGTHGGFIGVTDDGHNHFTNCVFNGKMVGSNTNSCGGFVGWTDAIYGNSSSDFTNCLFAPAELTVGSFGSATFSRGRDNNTANITLTNCYYASSFGTAQGTDGSSMTPNALASALGSVWIVQDSKVVPVLYYHFTGEGTEGNPYQIATATDWQGIVTNIKFYNENFNTKYFLQTADFSTTEMVGVCSGGSITKPFCGTYDGDSHTLTVNLPTATDDDAGPFRGIQGATIKNLHTAGTVDGGTFGYAGGIAGRAIGNSTIINCRSSVTVTASKNGDGSHGGLVGNSTGTTIEGCIFDGRLITTNNTYNCGGLVGWSQGGTIIRNCLFAPTEFTASMATNWSATFGRDGGNSGANYTITNSYYTQTFGKAQGKQTYSVTGAAGVTVANAGTATVYNVSGITSYGTGIKYNNVLYGGNGDNLSLAISGSTGYKPSAGTLTGADPYTLTMADANTIIYPAASCTAPTAINPTYTGVAQALVNAGTVTGGTMYYSLDNSAWDAAIPTGTAAGDYTVYYKVIGDATHADYTPSPNTVAATIAKVDPTTTAPSSKGDLAYTAADQELVNAGSGTGGEWQYKVNSGDYSNALPTGKNVGEYTVYYKFVGDANHNNIDEASFTMQITPTVVAITANADPEHPEIYYSTFYYQTQRYALPNDGTKAFVAELIGTDLLMHEIASGEDVIPEDVAVILQSPVSTINMTLTDADPVTVTDPNCLLGTDGAKAAPANCYVISGHSSDNSVVGVGFYQYTGTLKAHKAYTIYGGGYGAAPKRMRFVFNTTTGMDQITNDKSPITNKVIEDGVLYIIKNGVKYNAQGQIVK